MADNLLQKKNKKNSLLDRKESTTPKTTFNRENIYSVKEEAKIEPTILEPEQKKNKKKKTTTIRCEVSTSHRINAFVTVSGHDSVNELLEVLLDEHEQTYTADERREIRTLIDVYKRKEK